MITVSTELTLDIAKAFGVYMIAGGLSGLIAPGRWVGVIDEFKDRPGLTYMSGVFVYVIGVAIIFAHNIWTDALSGFISFVGWAAAFEGLLIIALPNLLLNFVKAILRPWLITAFAISVIILGVLLTAIGFTGAVG